MELEKKLAIPADIGTVWALLLNPEVMAQCVPGTQSVQVVSDVEYDALIQVKISFVSAKFKIKTKIVEQAPPHYLKTEGTGEDSSVGSSLKQTSEIRLTERGPHETELTVRVKVDIFGRLGSFGLNVMKTKADRMWEEFGQNFIAKVAASTSATGAAAAVTESAEATTPAAASIKESAVAKVAASTSATAAAAVVTESAEAATPDAPSIMESAAKPIPPVIAPATSRVDHQAESSTSWWRRVFGAESSEMIRVEISRGTDRIVIHWPARAGQDCATWLNSYLLR